MQGRTVVLNAARMNYDGKLDLSMLSPEVQVYEVTPPEQILERVEGYDVVVTKEMPVPADILSQFPASVKLLCEAGTGYNNIALDAARAKGITVCNIPAYSTERVAHTAILLMLSLASSMRRQMGMLAKGDTSNFTKFLQVDHTELNGKTLGVVGTGHIGREVIRIAQALRMRIVAYNRTPKPDEENLTYLPLDDVLKTADYVTLHCALTPETTHLMNAERLAMMKPTACVINTARGALIDEKALIAALQQGIIAGAGLDVQETEPPAAENPLYTLENVILTPHMGWKGLETRQRLVAILADNIKGFLAGTPQNVVS